MHVLSHQNLPHVKEKYVVPTDKPSNINSLSDS